MLLILGVLLLAIILGGLGFAIHVLWWIALVVLVIWLLGLPDPRGRGGRASPRPLVPLVAAPSSAGPGLPAEAGAARSPAAVTARWRPADGP